jgi:hypothetical protein
MRTSDNKQLNSSVQVIISTCNDPRTTNRDALIFHFDICSLPQNPNRAQQNQPEGKKHEQKHKKIEKNKRTKSNNQQFFILLSHPSQKSRRGRIKRKGKWTVNHFSKIIKAF